MGIGSGDDHFTLAKNRRRTLYVIAEIAENPRFLLSIRKLLLTSLQRFPIVCSLIASLGICNHHTNQLQSANHLKAILMMYALETVRLRLSRSGHLFFDFGQTGVPAVLPNAG